MPSRRSRAGHERLRERDDGGAIVAVGVLSEGFGQVDISDAVAGAAIDARMVKG